MKQALPGIHVVLKLVISAGCALSALPHNELPAASDQQQPGLRGQPDAAAKSRSDLKRRDWSQRFVYPGSDGKLVYDHSESGDRIPDFSHCGYGGGGVPIPYVPASVCVSPSQNDGVRIQAALDYVGSLSEKADGFRGAVLLSAGTFRLARSLVIRNNGVVLRGSGSASDPGDKRTTLVAIGSDRRSLIRISGPANPVASDAVFSRVVNTRIPCGATKVEVDRSDAFRTGDLVCVEHPGTSEWISALGMNRFPTRNVGSWLDWRPGTINIRWLRTVTAVTGQSLTLDVPLTSAIDASLTKALVHPCDRSTVLRHVGVENLACVSEFNAANSRDEDHSWNGVTFDNVQDGWVRQVSFRGFCGSAVSVLDACRRITIVDCNSAEPVSELGGWRRHTFFTSGTQTLFLRCRAANGRHDFSVGHAAAGPNAFSYCEAINADACSGPIGSWATGVLYDNVSIDGAPLALTNYETADQGTGWSSANGVLWNCTAPALICRRPPTAQNWAIGVWGDFIGDGHWRQLNEFVSPESLLTAQLSDRLGSEAARILSVQFSRANPGDAPAEFVEDSSRAVASNGSAGTGIDQHLVIRDARLLIDGKLAAGRRIGGQWWRGSVLPDRVGEFSDGITRFVPGRHGRGFTDDLNELTDRMQRDGILVFEHHWGLWYDRRRDDHQIVRRIDGAVWPPFYEQPWARSGIGTAWDGLSKYDLTKFNPWYFARLQEFAGHCDQKGRVLLQHMYFQHNFLEAAAHWVDFPWRSANCLQPTGFAEPPQLQNRKRVSLANEFWDVSHTARRELHTLYIRHCLDQLGRFRNVIFTTGEEFTGPTAFVEFWLDVIAKWQRERHRDVIVALSCTKDVQDQILSQPERAAVVDVIDVKYWWYTRDGGLFAPKGGMNLAPRQQLREHQGNRSRSSSSIAKAIEEYRRAFPEKVVICSLPEADSRTVIDAGGSLPVSVADASQK